MAAINAADGPMEHKLLSEENIAYNERIQSLRRREFPMLEGSAHRQPAMFRFLTQMA